MEDNDPILLTSEQAGKLINVSAKTLTKWRYEGKGPAFVRLGDGAKPRIRYRRSDLDAWAESLVVE